MTETVGGFRAAGLLLAAPAPEGSSEAATSGTAVLLQRRALWSHYGGTWALPGGAIDSHESPERAAMCEAVEETGVAVSRITLRAAVVTAQAELRDGGRWTYTTLIATAPEPLPTRPGLEGMVAWVRLPGVTGLRLHPGLAASWQRLTALVANLDSGTSAAKR